MNCLHYRIDTYKFADTGEPSGLWGCAECRHKFVPLDITPTKPTRWHKFVPLDITPTKPTRWHKFVPLDIEAPAELDRQREVNQQQAEAV